MAERELLNFLAWILLPLMSAHKPMRRNLNQTPLLSPGKELLGPHVLYIHDQEELNDLMINKVYLLTSYQCASVHVRITSFDIKYQIWKMGVVCTDNVSKGLLDCLRPNDVVCQSVFLLTCDVLLLQTFQYLVWYLVMSMLGHYNNFFFACHLLDIAMGVKTLRTILSSVTHNGKQVLCCCLTVGSSGLLECL